MTETNEQMPARRASLLRNYISFAGIAIMAAGLTSFLLLVLVELSGTADNPYTALVTYVFVPGVLLFGLFLILVGVIVERRRRRRDPDAKIARFPVLDLNDPQRRRSLLVFLVLSFIFLFLSAFGSYRAFEYTESVQFCGQTCHTVMKPEHTAYLAGSHARVRCVDCHVGSGASWYVKSKLSGAYQLYSVAFHKYSTPIATPVHDLRPAPQTCEQCHWPEKFFGAQLKVFNRYGDDEKNSLHQLRMLINVGGGSPATGQVMGIHWHMNIANEVSYIATDTHRQQIPWVRIKDREGKVTEYVDQANRLSDAQIAAAEPRRMDCVDCHNRPAHLYLPPDVAVDRAFTAGKLDPELPFLKRQSVAALSGSYETNDQALAAIDSSLKDYYRTNYPDIYSQKTQVIADAVTVLQGIYQTYFFPEMKTDWQTHPNNIGHFNFQGCFRCHDGKHVSPEGKVITKDCNTCHTTIYDSDAPPEKNVKNGPFKHPVDLGALEEKSCATCHVANKPFQHPINLGDISTFQCSVCHPRK